MKTLLLLLSGLTVTITALAQTPTTPTKTANERVGNLNSTMVGTNTNIVFETIDNRYAGLVGTPYFIPN